jgi:hypothetical protein
MVGKGEIRVGVDTMYVKLAKISAIEIEQHPLYDDLCFIPYCFFLTIENALQAGFITRNSKEKVMFKNFTPVIPHLRHIELLYRVKGPIAALNFLMKLKNPSFYRP